MSHRIQGEGDQNDDYDILSENPLFIISERWKPFKYFLLDKGI